MLPHSHTCTASHQDREFAHARARNCLHARAHTADTVTHLFVHAGDGATRQVTTPTPRVQQLECACRHLPRPCPPRRMPCTLRAALSYSRPSLTACLSTTMAPRALAGGRAPRQRHPQRPARPASSSASSRCRSSSRRARARREAFGRASSVLCMRAVAAPSRVHVSVPACLTCECPCMPHRLVRTRPAAYCAAGGGAVFVCISRLLHASRMISCVSAALGVREITTPP